MATPSRRANPEAQLRGFIAKFGPADQRRIRAVRMALRKRLPTANELVWDNYNFFVIGYSPTDRPTDAALSMAARAGGRFLWIRNLADPNVMLAIVATALTVLATGAGAASAQNRTLMLADFRGNRICRVVEDVCRRRALLDDVERVRVGAGLDCAPSAARAGCLNSLAYCISRGAHVWARLGSRRFVTDIVWNPFGIHDRTQTASVSRPIRGTRRGPASMMLGV